MRLQQQAQKLSNDITKLRDRQANRQRELDSVSFFYNLRSNIKMQQDLGLSLSSDSDV